MVAKLTAAVVQMRSGIDMDENIAAMEMAIKEAAKQGADYIQTPEMTGLVQQQRDAFFAMIKPQEEDRVCQAASQLAKDHRVVVHVGSTPILVGRNKAANRAFVYDQKGKLMASYDKIHMFDVDLDDGESWRESAVYNAGDKGVIVPLMGASFGLAICYDCRFPQLYRQYARAGVEILTNPSCFTRQTGKAHWHVLLRARAIENGAFMVASAQGGDMQDGRSTYGHSVIINPWGDIIAEVQGEEPGIALAEIDCHEVVMARAKVPNLKNQRQFSIEDQRL